MRGRLKGTVVRKNTPLCGEPGERGQTADRGTPFNKHERDVMMGVLHKGLGLIAGLAAIDCRHRASNSRVEVYQEFP